MSDVGDPKVRWSQREGMHSLVKIKCTLLYTLVHISFTFFKVESIYLVVYYNVLYLLEFLLQSLLDVICEYGLIHYR
jgi:hypothetical protein